MNSKFILVLGVAVLGYVLGHTVHKVKTIEAVKESRLEMVCGLNGCHNDNYVCKWKLESPDMMNLICKRK